MHHACTHALLVPRAELLCDQHGENAPEGAEVAICLFSGNRSAQSAASVDDAWLVAWLLVDDLASAPPVMELWELKSRSHHCTQLAE